LANVNLEPPKVDNKKSDAEDIIRILHVDDDADFLQVAKEILEMQRQFQVDTAGSVEEAYTKMKKKDFDVVVSDYQMPIKDGLEFLKELRYNKNSIPFILFTGKGREEVAIKALCLGADGYFIKSGDTETVFGELAHGIRQIVEKKRGDESLCERVKELHCLYELARLDEKPNMTVDQILEETVNLLPQEGENPDIAGARIVFENREYKTKNFKETLHKQQVDLNVNGKKVGIVELCYLEEIPTITKNLFINEEIARVYLIAEQLGKIIENKKAEEEIWSLAKFPSENPNPVLRVNKDGTLLFSNKAAEMLISEQKLDKNQHLAELFLQSVLDSLSSGLPKTLEIRLEDKTFSVEFVPVVESGYVNVYGRDVTERKKAEEFLRESEEKYRELLNGMNDTAFVMDFNGNFIEANDAAVRVLGFSREELLSMGPKGIALTASDDRINGLIERLSIGKQDVFETTHVTKDGKKIPVEVSFSLVTYQGKEAILSIARNITERKQMETKLFQQNKFMNSALDALTHPFYVIDAADYTIQLANSATGFDNYAENRTCYQVTHKSKKPCSAEHPCPLEIVKKTKKPAVTEHIHIDKNGDMRNVEVHGYPIFDNDGNVVQMIEYSLDITKQKKAEEELQSLAKFPSENPNPVLRVAKDGTVLFANDAAKRLLEKEKKAVGKAGPAFVRQIVSEVFSSGLSKEVEAEIGGLMLSLFFIPVTEGGYVNVYGRDISESKKAEEMLRASEERFREVFEGATDGILAADMENQRFAFANPRMCEITGYTMEELLKLGVADIHTKEDLPYVIEQFTKQADGKFSLAADIPVLRKDQQVIYCDVNSRTINIGKKRYLVGFFRDNTERKKTEDVLRKSEEKFRTLAEESPNMIFISVNDKLVYANKKIEEIIGYTRKELYSPDFNLLSLISPESHKAFMSNFAMHIRGKAVPSVEYALISRNGKKIDVVTNSKLIEYEGEQALLTIVTDISERKKSEKALLDTFDELALVNEKLGVVGRFTRHDVRNKLSAVLGNIYLAKKALPADNEIVKYLNETEVAVDQIEKIFDFARTYEQLGVEELSYVDVGKSFDSAVTLLSDLGKIEVLNECKDLSVLADSLLGTLFYNLIDNTIRHGEKVNQIRIHHKTSEDGLNLIYEDDGVGIPKDEKELIFKEGYGKNTGLGLYMIKKMCNVYGWTIQETGTLGKGAQFTMTVPKTSKNGKTAYQLQ
jgi:PAS domain S-box-containing protein